MGHYKVTVDTLRTPRGPVVGRSVVRLEANSVEEALALADGNMLALSSPAFPAAVAVVPAEAEGASGNTANAASSASDNDVGDDPPAAA